VVGSPAFLGEVTPLMLLWRLVRLEIMDLFLVDDSVLETRGWLRWLRREILRLAGRVLHS
jgi:hypothetical protein